MYAGVLHFNPAHDDNRTPSGQASQLDRDNRTSSNQPCHHKCALNVYREKIGHVNCVMQAATYYLFTST